jgi:hypothetical protein
MRVYLILTAILFALVAVMHVWRMIAESASLARDPFFLLLTVICVALSAWAVRLFVVSGRRTPPT